MKATSETTFVKYELPCPSCGEMIAPSASRCSSCDTSIPPLGRSPPAPNSAAGVKLDPASAPHAIRATPQLFAGERKYVTILFADLANSTALIADTDPEDAYDLLTSPVRLMIDAVHRYGGTVNQVLGDGIMAVFGAPAAYEDHAARACFAALAMRSRSRVRGAAAIRVGINSGEVVLRAVRNDLEFDYRAVGEAVHVAARMQNMARPGQTLITDATYRLAASAVTGRLLGRIPIKGYSHARNVFELEERRTADSRPFPLSPSSATPFVGREEELTFLREIAAEARQTSGSTIAICGEPGVGKSRLIHEFLKLVADSETRILAHVANPHEARIPLYPAAQIVRACLGIDASTSAAKIRSRITQHLSAKSIELKFAKAALLELLGQRTDVQHWYELDPGRRLATVRNAVVELLVAESLRRPMVIVIEDLQAADTCTIALLDSLVANASRGRLLLLVNYRPEHAFRWAAVDHAREMRLEALAGDELAVLLARLLGDHDSLAPLKKLLGEHTAGVPFFAEQCVRALAEDGVLAGLPGDYRLVDPTKPLRIPESVQGVVAARIDRLRPEEKWLTLVGAVIGRRVDPQVLRDVTRLDEETFKQTLAAVCRAELLVQTRLFPQIEYTFRHSLIQEVAYGFLLRDRRRELHGRTLEALERRFVDRLDQAVEQLAFHAIEAQQWSKALDYCRRAGAKALAESANREAAEFYEQALGALDHLPQEPQRDHIAVTLWLDLADCYFPLGRHDRVLECANKAGALAEKTNDPCSFERITSTLALHHCFVGDTVKALHWQTRALAIAEECGNLESRVNARSRLGSILLYRGQYREAWRHFSESIEATDRQPLKRRYSLAGPASVLCRASIAWSAAELGEFEIGLAIGDEALRIAEQTGHPFSLVYVCRELGIARAARGDLERARTLLEQAAEQCRKTEAPLLEPPVAVALGRVLTLLGDAAAGLPMAEGGLERARAMGLHFRLSRLASWYGEALLHVGEVEAAAREGWRALQLARRHGEEGHEAWAEWLLGQVHARLAGFSPQSSVPHFLRALDGARRLSMSLLEAHCHDGLARAYAAGGRNDQAAAEIAASRELYRLMGIRLERSDQPPLQASANRFSVV